MAAPNGASIFPLALITGAQPPEFFMDNLNQLLELLAVQVPSAASPAFTGTTLTLADGQNVVVGTSSGSQFGTTASQKLAFFGATPVVQPVASAELFAALNALGLLPTGTHNIAVPDGGNVVFGATSGTQIGTAASQKLAFFGATAVIQPVASAELFATLNALGLLPTGTHNIAVPDGGNIVLGATSGTQLGSTSSQKLGFFGATPVIQPVASAELFAALNALGLLPTGTHNISVPDGGNIVLGGTTGTQIGTAATSQKLGFFGATPVIQPTSSAEATVSTAAVSSAAGIYGYTFAQGTAIITLVNELRNQLVNLGLIKGS